jgi:ParB family chromosome partitioning protein
MPNRGAADTHHVPVEMIDPDPENARRTFPEQELHELADSLKRHGQVHNVVAFRDDATGRYRLLAGERRLRAAKIAGLPTLRVWVVPRHAAADTLRELSVAENLCRQDLSPIETARHMHRLMTLWGCSGAELARRIGVAQSTVSKRLALLKLDDDTAAKVDAGNLTQTEAVDARSTKRKHRARSRGGETIRTKAAGAIRLRRGHTLADLVAELARIDQAKRAA